MRFFLIFFLLVFVIYTSSAQYKVGDIVDDISVSTYDEASEISLDDYEELDGVIVVFTSAKCAEARAYTNRLIELQKKTAPQGYPVLAIDISSQPEDRDEEEKTEVQKYVEEQEVNFSYGIDPERDIFESFAPPKVPAVYLLKNQIEDDEDPGFSVVYYGAIDDNAIEGGVKKHYLEDALKYVMEYPSKKSIGKDARNKKHKALKPQNPFGCTLRKL